MSGFYVMEPRPYTVPKDLIKFVNTYAPSYFLGNPQIVPSARQSSPWAEEEIDKVLESKQGLRHRKDVIRVLAWKMGGLNHKSSTEEYPFIFFSLAISFNFEILTSSNISLSGILPFSAK